MANPLSRAIDLVDKVDAVLSIPEWLKKVRGWVVSIGTAAAMFWLAVQRMLIPNSILGLVGVCALLALTASCVWIAVELIYWRIKREIVIRRADLIIHLAEYGVEGEEPWQNVTLRVRSYITNDSKIRFRVANELVPTDPHQGAHKLLRVTYSFMEVRHREIVRLEGQELILP